MTAEQAAVEEAAHQPGVTDVGELLIVSPTGLGPGDLDRDAVEAVARLQDRGHEAYLVGGCVRDLLLGHAPKDFDIATSARPSVVKRTFPRNCRIIGRRFKLAHLHYERNTKILEVSTFRRAPQPDAEESEDDQDLLITRDNEFGTAEEDALRRDFTINALFYDPIRDEIVDHAGGLADVEARVIRTIGQPVVRFREDPVRILRAIKFAGRLGLDIEPETAEAMAAVAPDLVRSAPPRVLEEILRLLRGGHALDAFQRLRDLGALQVLMPMLHEFLESAPRDARLRFWRTLEALDGRHLRHARDPRRSRSWPPANGVLLGALFEAAVRERTETSSGHRAATGLAEEILSPFANDFRLPRRDAGCLKRICAVQHRFVALHDDELNATERGHRKRRFRPDAFLRDPFFTEALQLFELTTVAEGGDLATLADWQQRERSLPGGSAGDDRDTLDGDRYGDDRGRDDRGRDDRRTGEGGGEDRSERDRSGAAGEGEGRGKRKRKRKRNGREDRDDRVRSDRPRDERAETGGGDRPDGSEHRKSKKDKKDKRKDRKKDRGGTDRASQDRGARKRAAERVETIEPEAIDVSAFDVELDPRRVATFGAIVEGQGKKKRRHIPSVEDDDYRPPPADDSGGAPLPPPPASEPSGDGLFGDW